MADTEYKINLILEAQNKASTEIQKVSGQITGMQDALARIGISAIAISAVKKASSAIIELAGNLEQAEVAFSTMLGSEEKATQMLNELSDFAKKTPFELTGIRESAKQLLAMGIDAEDMMSTLKSLGDVSAGLSVGLDRLALNYGQVAAQGHLTGLELKDFRKMGVPLVAELAKNLGKTEAEIENMVSKGQVSFEDVTNAFRTMTSEGGKFDNLMDAQSKTFQGMVSNLKDSFASMGESIGSVILPLLERLLSAISPIIQDISMNRYDIKVYSKTGVYQTTINPNVVMNDISFTSNVNGGLGELDLELALPFSDNTFHGGEIMKVDLFNERYKQGKQIYYGYVSQISRIFDINKGYIQLSILGIASLLNSILYSGTKTGSVSSILTDIINAFNSKYSGNLITIGGIDTYSEDIEIELNDGTTCKSAIDKINDICNYYWFIDSGGKFRFKRKGNQKRHILANEQNIESMNITSSIEKIYNKVYVSRKDGEIKQYQNTTSQSLYGIKEKYENEPSIANESTQDEYGNNYILENSNPKNVSSIVVNSSYDIESIVPGDIISVVNIDFDITDLLIEKIKYGNDKVVLTLDENESLWGVIK